MKSFRRVHSHSLEGIMLKGLKWLLFAVSISVLLGPQDAGAMPNFARKLGVPCETCHTTIPRLNETGYKFRAAGFRLPEMLGKSEEKNFELGDYFAARLQARYDTQVTNQPNSAPVANVIGGVAGPRKTTNALSFQEFTVYPLTGSWGKHFASLSELSTSPEDVFEIENAYVRFVFGNSNKFFTSRVGIFHPWEGFGASDRPFSNARPFFQTVPISAGGRGIPFVFQPWGLDEAGLEIGADINKLSLRAAVLNGTIIRWDEEANSFLPFPAQTGPWKGANQAVSALNKPFNSPAHSTPDFSANATYVLHSNGGGISLIYYRGNLATPTQCTDGTAIGKTNAGTGQACGVTGASASAPFGTVGNVDFDFSSATAYRNNFDRVGLYGSYPIGKHFLPQAGFQYGRDTIPVNAASFPTVPGLTKFDSKGAFADGSYMFNQYVTGGFRYDWYKPKYATATFNTQWAVTPYVSVPLQNGFQIIAEYQHRDFQLNATNHRQNDTFQARIIFIK
jgi:hypothetical protein